jgi:hypothetical protein
MSEEKIRKKAIKSANISDEMSKLLEKSPFPTLTMLLVNISAFAAITKKDDSVADRIFLEFQYSYPEILKEPKNISFSRILSSLIEILKKF